MMKFQPLDGDYSHRIVNFTTIQHGKGLFCRDGKNADIFTFLRQSIDAANAFRINTAAKKLKRFGRATRAR